MKSAAQESHFLSYLGLLARYTGRHTESFRFEGCIDQFRKHRVLGKRIFGEAQGAFLNNVKVVDSKCMLIAGCIGGPACFLRDQIHCVGLRVLGQVRMHQLEESESDDEGKETKN
jgi:hypothetical protein